MPIKLRNCLLVVGGLIFSIDSIFLGRGLIPLRVTQKPKYSNSDFPKKDLLVLTFRPASCSLCNTISN